MEGEVAFWMILTQIFILTTMGLNLVSPKKVLREKLIGPNLLPKKTQDYALKNIEGA